MTGEMTKVISYRFKAVNKGDCGKSDFSVPVVANPNVSPEYGLLIAYAIALKVAGFEIDELVEIPLVK